MPLFGEKGHTVTSPPEFTPEGLRRECTCGSRTGGRGGGLADIPVKFGGTKALSVFSEASILEMTTC